LASERISPSPANLSGCLFVEFPERLKEIMPSTVISKFNYNAATETLQIKFISGMVYNYLKVPEQVYLDMKNSRAKGIYFNEHIKDSYKFEKVGMAKQD
jgi:hypothetical protein